MYCIRIFSQTVSELSPTLIVAQTPFHLPFSDSACTLPGMGTSLPFRHYFSHRSTLTQKFFVTSSWHLPPCSSLPRALSEDNCSSWHLNPQSALSFKVNSPTLSSRPHGMNDPSFDRALGGLALEDTQSLCSAFPHLTWAWRGLSRGETLRQLILPSEGGQQGQEGGTHLPIGGDCCKHSGRVWGPGHVAHG